MNKIKILFLAGMPRSGTTLIQGLLNGEGCVCLGEVCQTIKSIRKEKSNNNILRPTNSWDVTGYDEIKYDDFWLAIQGKIKQAKSFEEALSEVYTEAESKYPNALFIDSSKHIGHLKIYEKLSNMIDLKVLLIVRDYRGWRLSYQNSFIRSGIKPPKLILARWVYVNSRLKKYLRSKSHLIIYFDKFIINKEYKNMDSLVGEVDFKKYKDAFHEMFGSRHNLSEIKNRSIKYDLNWIINQKVNVSDWVIDKIKRRLIDEN